MIGVTHIDSKYIRAGDEHRPNLLMTLACRPESGDNFGLSAAAHHVSGQESGSRHPVPVNDRSGNRRQDRGRKRDLYVRLGEKVSGRLRPVNAQTLFSLPRDGVQQIELRVLPVLMVSGKVPGWRSAGTTGGIRSPQ